MRVRWFLSEEGTVDMACTMWVGLVGACASNLGSPFRRDKDVAEIKVVARACNAWRGRDLGRTGNIVILSVFETLLKEEKDKWNPPITVWK